MAQDLYSRSFASLMGTVTSDVYDVSRLEGFEVFATSGSAIGTAGGTQVTILVDVQDFDGNWYNTAAGSFSMGTSTTLTKSRRRGENVGAADPTVMGMKQRVRVISAGSIEFGINVVGF